MQPAKRNLKALYPTAFCIALAWLLLLIVLPGTGWLVRYQLKMLFSRPNDLIQLLNDYDVKDVPGLDTESPPPETLPQTDAAGSYQDRLGAALSAQQKARVAMIQNLAISSSGHQRAEALAHALRFLTLDNVRTGRDDEVDAYWGEPPSPPIVPTTKPSVSDLDLFDKDAKDGESLEPDNAYFPMMRAIGLIAARRDAEALNAILRAGSKSRYEDYAMNDGKVRLAFLEHHKVRQSAASTLILMNSIPLPQYAPLRGAARFIAYKADQEEKVGRKEDGLALRKALMLCGSLMRVQSRCLIGNLVGMAIVQIALRNAETRSGGLPPAKWKALSTDQKARRRGEIYITLLTRSGHAHEIPWLRSEVAAGIQVKDIFKKGIDRGPMVIQALHPIFDKNVSAMVLLANAAQFLALCLVLWLLKGKRIAEYVAIVILFVLFVVIALRMQWAPAIGTLQQVIMGLNDADTTSSAGSAAGKVMSNSVLSSPMVARSIAFVASLLGPVLALGVFGLLRIVRGKQEESVLASGFRKGGAVMSLLLVGMYTVSFVGLLRLENQERAAQQKVAEAEGPYYANLVGSPWPR